MRKIVKDGKVAYVRRDMSHISLYVDKLVCEEFNYEDWADICTGLKLDIKTLRRRPRDYYVYHNWTKIAVSAAVSKLSQDRLLRVAYLALRALVPSSKMFYLNYLMIFGEDYVPEHSRVTDFDGLLAIADEALIKSWYEEISVLILPLLKEIFASIYQLEPYDSMGNRRLPNALREFIYRLKEEAKLLPVYWTDFTGRIINGEIYHEPYPSHLPPIAREAYWRGGHHVKHGEIYMSQVCEQGGSFGPVCLSVIEALVHPFLPAEGYGDY